MKQRGPHCKDDHFEENTIEALHAHLVIRKMMAQFGQVDVGIDGDTIDDDGLVDVAKHSLIQDEDKDLCAVEIFSGMMQARQRRCRYSSWIALMCPKPFPYLMKMKKAD